GLGAPARRPPKRAWCSAGQSASRWRRSLTSWGREADVVDEQPRVVPESAAAAGSVEVLQGGMPGRRAEEVIHLCQRAGQIGEPRVVLADRGRARQANPAQGQA